MDQLRRNLFWVVLGVVLLGAGVFYLLAVRRLDAQRVRKEKDLKRQLRRLGEIITDAGKGKVPNERAIQAAKRRKEAFRSHWGRGLLYFAMRDARLEEPLPGLNEEAWRTNLQGLLLDRRKLLLSRPKTYQLDLVAEGTSHTFTLPDPPGLNPDPLVRAHRVYRIQLKLLDLFRDLAEEVATSGGPAADSPDAIRVCQVNRIDVGDPTDPPKVASRGPRAPPSNFRLIPCKVSLFVNIRALNRLLSLLLASRCNFRIDEMTVRRWDRRRKVAAPGVVSRTQKQQLFSRFPLLHPPRQRGTDAPPPPIYVQLDLQLQSEDYRGAVQQVVFVPQGKRWAQKAEVEAWVEHKAQQRPSHTAKPEEQLVWFLARAIRAWQSQEASGREIETIRARRVLPGGLGYTLREENDFRRRSLSQFEVADGVVCIFGFLNEKAY